MASYIGRRKFLATLLGGAAAWPLAAWAQQSAMPVVGFLNTRVPGADPHLLAAFRRGLKETGYVEGQNVTIEYRWAYNQYDRLPALAADLVRRQVTVIAAIGSPSAPAAKATTTTIPIVFIIGFDPVEVGLVTSLNRPGGNLTGVTVLGVELGSKRLELLHELAPTANIVAALVNPNTPAVETQSTDLQTAARSLGLKLHVLHASSERDFDTVFASLLQLGAGGLVVGNDTFFSTRSEQLAALALRHGVPAIFQYRQFVEAGGLMSYGGDLADNYRLTGVYTGRVLKGEKPADLPVMQSTKVELIINLKTARALGLTVPLTMLGRADEVIE
jgi:putative tryptophan/tyrosine transport system substrate-binding protein